MNVLFLMANGFEETEFVTPFDYFKRAGIQVTLASIQDDLTVIGAHQLKIATDISLNSIKDFSNFDGVLLPGGGPGVKNLKESPTVAKVIQEFDGQSKWVFAICAAPLVLSQAGLLKSRKCTCFPGCEAELICKEFTTDRVVVDKNIVTSRGAGTAEEFAFECISQMLGYETSQKIRNQVVAR